MTAVLALLTLSVGALDAKIWKSWFTPCCLALVPTALLALLCECLGGSLGFKSVDPRVMALVLGGGLLALAVGCAVRWVAPNDSTRTFRPIHGAIWLRGAWFSIAAMAAFLTVRKMAEFGGVLQSLGKDDFQEATAGGLVGHLRILCQFLLAFCLTSFGKLGWIDFISALLSVFVVAAYPVKGWILMGIFAPWLGRQIMYGKRIKASHVLTIVVGGVVVFFGVYFFAAGALDSDSFDALDFLGTIGIHMMKYLFAGLLGFSGMIENPPASGGLDVLFAPFVNFGRILSGDAPVAVISEYFYPTNLMISEETNVFTYWGTIYANVGAFAGSIVAAGWFFVGYLLFAMRHSLLGGTLYQILAMVFLFAWFDYYFLHLFFLECAFYAVLVCGALRLLGPTDESRASIPSRSA